MNHLYPIFLKADQLKILITGSGELLLEKVKGILDQSPLADLKIISAEPGEETESYLRKFPHVRIQKRKFEEGDLAGVQVLILASRDRNFNEQVSEVARQEGILVNAADMPDLCSFYLGSVLQKGDLKLGISTNGKSPVLAKRLREFFDDVIPDDIDSLITELHAFRNSVKGDFRERAKKMNEITKVLVQENN
jgi:siroheme synthase-like protein